MFHRLIHLWVRYVGDVGVWHAQTNYPREEHGVPMPIYSGASATIATAENNVTPFRVPMEGRHG